MSGSEAGKAGSRPTPFALGLPGRRWVQERFAAIEEEARSRGTDLADPSKFLLLAQVGASLQDLRPDEGETSPELFHTFGMFLFHAFHLLRGGTRGLLLDVERSAARYLVEAEPTPGAWDRSLPAPAGYLRLPQNLFWTRPGGEAAPAEPVDGISWCTGADAASAGTDAGAATEGDTGLSLVVITGVRGDRPGFSVLPLPVVPMADVEAWLGRKARPEGAGEDFETTLPGGDLGNLYSVETTGEVLKLVARALGYAVTTPDAMSAVEAPAPAVGGTADAGSADAADDAPVDGAPADAGLASATLRLVGTG
ncbi:hypothetical protein BH23GEM11_BH23GEM11_15370 [soil metagenome]